MNLSILSGCRLFAGIPAARIPALLHSLGAYEKRFAKGQPIYRVGDIAHALCIVLSGSVTIERDDAWGNKSSSTTSPRARCSRRSTPACRTRR